MIALVRRLFADPDPRTSHPLYDVVLVDGLRVVRFLRETGYVAHERWTR